MTDPRPGSELPPAGWYDDPYGQPLLRYWDGMVWTEQTSKASSGSGGGGLSPFGDWLNRTFQLVISRAGHLLAMVAVTLVPLYLVLGFFLWSGLSDGVVTIDTRDSATGFEEVFQFEGFRPGLLVAGLALIIPIFLASLTLRVGYVRQAVLAFQGRPETWAQSLGGGVRRLARVIAVGVQVYFIIGLLLLIPTGLAVVGAVVGGDAGAGLVAVSGILLLAAIPFALWLVIRLWMAWVVVAVGPRSSRAVPTAWSLSRGRVVAFLGRGALLVAFGFLIQSFASGVMSPLVGAALPAESLTIESGDVVEVDIADFLGGAGLAGLLLSQMVSTLLSQASWAIQMSGSALAYLDLDGPIED